MYYKFDEETIWESTDIIVVNNYPASPHTFTYITRIYREYKKDKYGSKEIEGQPIYLADLSPELAGYVKIIGEAQNILNNKLPVHKFLGKPIDPKNLFL